MFLKRIKVSNFKSFKDNEIFFGDLNVLIGANSSGKSNFVGLLKFLSDIFHYGLDDAISFQGGIEYFSNQLLKKNNLFNIEVEWLSNIGPMGFDQATPDADPYSTNHYSNKYCLCLETSPREYRVRNESIIIEGNVKPRQIGISLSNDALLAHRLKEQYSFKIIRENNKLIHNSIGKGHGILSSIINTAESNLDGHSLLASRILFKHFPSEKNYFNFSFFDIDPKTAKDAIPLSSALPGRFSLSSDAKNLPVVLKNILSSKEQEQKLFNLINFVLPIIKKIDTQNYMDGKHLIFKIKESFSPKAFPSFLISDGTINIIALIIALYFQNSPLVVIEEPERGIHPYLIGRVVEMMKDASGKTQIIVTTHNPEVVKWVGIENLLLAHRDEHGFSQITKPSDNEDIVKFAKDNLGIDQLFINNLIEQ